MVSNKKVILITGPSGSGKTSLAKRIAENKGWTFISEDSVWGEFFPNHESRTEEMHKKVVYESINRILNNASNVVFEFLVYTNPPKIISKYGNLLKKHKIEYNLFVLKPSKEAILSRKSLRNGKDDQNQELNNKNTEHQLNCLDSKSIPKRSIISDSNSSLEEIYQKYLKSVVESV